MAQNESGGAIQVGTLDLLSINTALAQLQEALDQLRGLKGPVSLASTLSIGGVPSGATDSARLSDVHANVTDPFAWLLKRMP